MKNEECIQRVKRKVLEHSRDYCGCSQTVLGALQEEFRIGNRESFKAATVLSWGLPVMVRPVVPSSVLSRR